MADPMQRYILKGRDIVEASLAEWTDMFWRQERRLAESHIGDVSVSTVFTGVNYSLNDPPLLFETMIFGGPDNYYQEVCETYDEALEMHERVCAKAFGRHWRALLKIRQIHNGDQNDPV